MTLNPSSEEMLALQWKGFLNTPPLWREPHYFPFPQYLIQKEKALENFPKITIPPNMVLGKRMERYFQLFIKKFSEEEILAENIQIISEKVTLGELDFILKNNRTGKTSHVEVVYKFYLYDPNFDNEIERWIGPNRRDSLQRKLSRLKEHQFPLLYREETKPLLGELGINPRNVEQKALFKANLFVPLSLLGTEVSLVNNECIKGYWIGLPDFTPSGFGDYEFFTPKKPNWPVEPKYGQVWYSYSDIREQLVYLLKQKKSPLVWMKKNETEFARFFLVWWQG